MQIAIAAHSSPVDPKNEAMAREFLKELHSQCPSITLLLGGYWGFMKSIVDEALKLSFKVVVILPLERHDVELPSDAIRIDSGCEFRCRSVIMVRSSDALVALGGGAGTIIEVLLAYAMGKPAYVLTGTNLSSDNLPKAFPEYIDERKVIRIRYFDDPVKLAREICRERITPVKAAFG
ncbi:Rossmann fold nucleotide-binding protein-like protein [Vulcanisaeta moutnovskia 768-28]|uniref:Rossmann fold nucleotide-binding protein-like protein n=1 Tax=Vulcanisaeta moutnovskia (strain 768-28) TaxID=985053 RepID=F0QVP7_VULM7|nr:LOG family protein [Vulcanisaeta moutnovskia]ADY02071.1 Rossmann fold nucleotide-binding protein-like protein [Vulcanisaeta moutnovskia 768-28]